MTDQTQPARGWLSSAPIVVYTLARRFPETINRTPDGRKIPGGPYTLTGFVTALVVLIGGLKYAVPLINHLSGNSVMGFFVIPAAAIGAGVGVSRLPVEGRNPIQLVTGFVTAASSPRHGVIDGRAVKTVPTRAYASCVQVLDVPAQMVPAALRHDDDLDDDLDDAHAHDLDLDDGETAAEVLQNDTTTDLMTAASAAMTKEARRAA